MKIGVLGIGRLGICFALNLERTGYTVCGVDIAEAYVESINNKTLQSPEPEVETLLKGSKNLTATTHIGEVLTNEFPLLFVMVATPSLPDGSYDHSQIERITGALINSGKRGGKPVHVVIGCTVMPGFCDELQKTLAPYNYLVSYNPEFIAQGSIIKDQLYCDQVLIGEANTEAGDLIESVYKKLCKSKPLVCRMNRLSAEICKLATNCFLTTKIAFANAIGDLATVSGAEPEKILAAVGADSRIGAQYLKYGFGYGGPCFPRDNRALNIFARNQNYGMLIGEATDKMNSTHLQFQVSQYLELYGENETIVFNEVTYKPGTVILEESQQLALALKLAQAGRKVLVKEKPAVIDELKRRYAHVFMYEVIK
ncbi:MAG TPA: nucleotide sugar dehydrogenase [Chitinophagales bacterium]|nr:nucleotide sugar dehydrogenase [Chitinophagales bacterium]